jgi:holo-[acyl-carrier protein] synthase
MLLSGIDMIAGTGIDLVDVGRLKKIIAKWGGRFTGRFFSQHEIDYCQKRAVPAIHYAARFAAKESFLKSLGIGLGMGVNLKDIEVMNDQQGKPDLILHGEAQRLLSERGIQKVHLSLTHTSDAAVAVVILESQRDR